MENLAAVDDLGRASIWTQNGRSIPAPRSPPRYKPPCYDRQTTYALYINGTDFAGVFELCGTAESDFQSSLLRGSAVETSAAETKLITDDDGAGEGPRPALLPGKNFRSSFQLRRRCG